MGHPGARLQRGQKNNADVITSYVYASLFNVRQYVCTLQCTLHTTVYNYVYNHRTVWVQKHERRCDVVFYPPYTYIVVTLPPPPRPSVPFCAFTFVGLFVAMKGVKSSPKSRRVITLPDQLPKLGKTTFAPNILMCTVRVRVRPQLSDCKKCSLI